MDQAHRDRRRTLRFAPCLHLLPPDSPNYRPLNPQGFRGELTGETKIELSLALDGSGTSTITTGVGFFGPALLKLLSHHSLIDLTVQAAGDLHVDAHHTVEDVGICFGKALAEALAARPESAATATQPCRWTRRWRRPRWTCAAGRSSSGRPTCRWRRSGTLRSTLAEEFWRAVSSSGAFALHVVVHHGRNTPLIEAIFKATARRALREAVELDPRSPGVPSTKGVL